MSEGKKLTDDYIEEYEQAGFDGERVFSNLLNRGFYSGDEMYQRGTTSQIQTSIFDELINNRDLYTEAEAEDIKYDIDESNFWDSLLGTHRAERDANEFIIEGQRRLADYRANIDLNDIFDTLSGKGLYNSTPKSRKMSYKIGFNFNGIKEIEEFENDEFYIPNSNHCIFKCLNKFYTLSNIDYQIEYNYTKSNITLEGYRTYLKSKDIKEDETPKIFKIVNNKAQPLTHKNTHTCNKFAILLLPQTLNKTTFQHSILLKIPDEARRERGDSKIIRLDYITSLIPQILENLHYTQNKTLSDKSERIKKPLPQSIKNVNLYTFDYETYSEDTLQIPVGVSLVKFELTGEIKFTKHFILDSFDDLEAKTTAQSRLQKDFIDSIFNDMAEDGRLNSQIFAHNGGGFDLVILKQYLKDTNYRWANMLKSGGKISSIELIKKVGEDNYILTFKDSYNFVLCPLKDACETFKTEIKKIDFDIAGLKLEDYIELNKKIEEGKEWAEWVEYMRVDSICLSQVIIQAEKLFNTFNQSFIYKNGLPSIAWGILENGSNACFLNVYIHKDLTTEKFIRASQYGGRIIHWRCNFLALHTKFDCPKLGKYTSRGLISLDANSLYPSAMAKFEYPHGKPQIINNQMSFKAFQEVAGNRMYIAEIKFKTKNQKYIITPYKQEKPRLLQYKCSPPEGLYGVYNSVDIQEMLHEGFEIETVYRAVIYKNKSLMFDDIIYKLYKMRQETDDEVLKHVIKTIINSIYGKFSEDIDTISTYKEQDKGNKEIGHIYLGNGQTEYNYRLNTSNAKKPAQIGSFILANARKIMNELIRDLGRENILYGDTDSIYCTIESWEYLQSNNSRYSGLNTELGGFKNDYGNGVLITEAYFLDNKRYFLKFNQEIKGKAYKVKWNGLNWKTAKGEAMKQAGAKYGDDLEEAELTANIFKDFYSKYFKGEAIDIINSFNQIKFKKGDSINILNITQNYNITPEIRNIWRQNEEGDYISYPLNYSFNEPEQDHKKRNDYLRIKTPERSKPYLITLNEGEILANKPLKFSKTLLYKEAENEKIEYPKFLINRDTGELLERITFFNIKTNLYDCKYYKHRGKFGMTNEEEDDLTNYIAYMADEEEDIRKQATKEEILNYRQYELENPNILDKLSKEKEKRREYIKNKTKK